MSFSEVKKIKFDTGGDRGAIIISNESGYLVLETCLVSSLVSCPTLSCLVSSLVSCRDLRVSYVSLSLSMSLCFEVFVLCLALLVESLSLSSSSSLYIVFESLRLCVFES